ncbi:MAG TPA: hypothetical protein VKK79_01180 [Candidatus Lokiarchaeia archaeon]|nr:hypothetical protein [Candidatus Lokiarchaeia archaeon]
MTSPTQTILHNFVKRTKKGFREVPVRVEMSGIVDRGACLVACRCFFACCLRAVAGRCSRCLCSISQLVPWSFKQVR